MSIDTNNVMSFDQSIVKAAVLSRLAGIIRCKGIHRTIDVLLVLALLGGFGVVPALAQSSEKVPRVLLENMARGQYAVLCDSSVFTGCMGFSGTECLDLSEIAIEQCLLPLPEAISPDELDNAAIESCPKKVFEDAGFSEEKAGMCFDKAMESQ
ncbi:MAG: hypothetical protein AB8B87_17380 [Granulosicoccus sp.]